MLTALTFAAALVIGLVVTPIVRTLAHRLELLDMPGGRKVHQIPVPRLGGVAMIIAFGVAISAEMVWHNLLGVGPAVWVLNAAAMAVGLLLGRAIGADSRDSMTLAIEVGVHNVTLAVFLTLTVLNSLPLALTQNIYGVVMLLNGTLLVRWFRARIAAREEVAAA